MMLTATTEAITRFVREHVSPTRYEHSLRVGETAVRLCRKYGVAVELGLFAGLAHDMCKGLRDDDVLRLASKDGAEISAALRKKPTLLHGRAAAVQLREEFGVSDEAVLEAVRHHTFGKAGMGDVAQVVYVADKIEPGRPQVTDAYVAALEGLTLPQLLYTVASENIAYLDALGKQVAPESRELIEWLTSKS